MESLLRSSGSVCPSSASICILQDEPECIQEGENICESYFTFIIFPFFALFLGTLATPIARKIKVSYTLVLLIFGIILGMFGCGVPLGLMTTSLRQWVHLHPPTAFFYIFLAPLIFEASFNTRWYVFKRLLVPILTAAFIIVMLQVGLIAAFQKLVIRTANWSWWSALMFGSMLSATDPISVTATLKSLGASELLNTLIEGESLVNDGSAFVLWEAFFENTIDPESLSVGEIVRNIFRLSIGGMAMGIAFGIAALVILGLVYDEFEVETSLTVIVAFLGFWTAQAPSRLSGVICNVASGLVISAFGRHLITPAVREPLAEFWELLGWIANTIVFVHAGVLLTAFTWSCSGEPNEWYDYLYIFGYYIFLQVIRMGLIFIFLPIMRFRNQWFGWKEAFVVGFSGLRGAVSLILALEVAGSEEIPDEVRSRVVLWTTGIVALSLLVNGVFVKPLISTLKLDKAKKSREDFLQRARALMVQKSLMILDVLCIETNFKSVRWSYVLKSVLPHEWLEETEHAEGYRDIIEQVLDNKRATMRKSLDVVRNEANEKMIHTHIGQRMSAEFGTQSVFSTPKISPRASRYDYASDIARYSRSPSMTAAGSAFVFNNMGKSPGLASPAFGRHMPSRYQDAAHGEDVLGVGYKATGGVAGSNRTSMGQPTTAGNAAPQTPMFRDTRIVPVTPMSRVPMTPMSMGFGSPTSMLGSPAGFQRSIDADLERYGAKIGPPAITSPSGIHREVAALHRSAVAHGEHDDLNEKDREVRRRLLTAILSHVRAVSNTSFVEFSVLHSLEEDCQKALDANEEGHQYDIFSFLDNYSVLSKGPVYHLFIKALEGRNFRGEMAITTAFVISGIMTEVLKEGTLLESEIVQWQAEKLYEGAAALLNRFESLNPEAFEWVESQFAVYMTQDKQDDVLRDLLESGIVDDQEYHTLHEELVDVRRAYVHHRHAIFQRNRKKLPECPNPRQLLAKHPLFCKLPRQLMQVADRYGELVHLKSGQALQAERGSLVLVLEGLIRPVGETMLPPAHGSSTAGGQGNSPSNRAEGEDTVDIGDHTAGINALGAGAEMHWCFPRNNAFCGPITTLRSHSNIDGSSMEIEEGRALDTQFGCCEIAGKATVFTLPVKQVKRIAKESIDFRLELTRSLARQIVLESLTDQRPYSLSQFMDNVSGGLDTHTVIGRATRVLERLPYMKVIALYNGEMSSLHIQGPGVLLNGTVRVSIVDTSGLIGAINLLHEEVTGPALLPAGGLLLEEVLSPEEIAGMEMQGEQGDGQGQSEGAKKEGEVTQVHSEATKKEAEVVKEILEAADEPEIEVQTKKRAQPAERAAPPVVKRILAHVLIEEVGTDELGLDETAIKRLHRWTQDDEIVDMNGRFGMNRHVELAALTHVHVHQHE